VLCYDDTCRKYRASIDCYSILVHVKGPLQNFEHAVEATQDLCPLVFSLKEKHGFERGCPGLIKDCVLYLCLLHGQPSIYLKKFTCYWCTSSMPSSYQINIADSRTYVRVDGLRTTEHLLLRGITTVHSFVFNYLPTRNRGYTQQTLRIY
jgi:hypothetical protein